MKGKLKIIAGIVWMVVFIAIIVVLYTLSNKGLINWSFLSKYKGPSGLVTQQVVTEESSVINVVKKVSPSVVSIVAKTVSFDIFSGPVTTQGGIGTGFIVDANGLIVTNSHVVDDPNSQYSVILNDGRTFPVNKVFLDEQSDIAILEITARGLPAVTLGNSSGIQVGQMSIAIGNALGRYQNSVTVGVISGIARQLQAYDINGQTKVYEDAIQTDASLNPGNSGGPLLNSVGQVVGINMATTLGAENINFAIPVNILKPILEGFLKNGRIVRAYLGVSYQMITTEISTVQGLPAGAFVSAIMPGSPADKAGLTRGDIIIKANGKTLDDNVSLSQVVSGNKVGDKFNMVVDRNGQQLNLTANLAEAPGN